jgi:hypothetical protein
MWAEHANVHDFWNGFGFFLCAATITVLTLVLAPFGVVWGVRALRNREAKSWCIVGITTNAIALWLPLTVGFGSILGRT